MGLAREDEMKIEAAVFREASPLPKIERLEMTGPLKGEILVRIVATGVCHTDLKSAGRRELCAASGCPRS